MHLILRNPEHNLQFQVFELKEDYSLWSLKHCVNLNFSRVDLNFPQLGLRELRWGRFAGFAQPFYIICEAKEGSSMLVLLINGISIPFNSESYTLRKLRNCKPDMMKVDVVVGYWDRVFQHYESLSLVETFNA